MRVLIGVAVGVILASSRFASADALANPHSKQAFYVVSPAAEGQGPPVSELAIIVGETQPETGRALQWWELSARMRDDGQYGLRLLSERVPMTSPDGIGHVERYIYCDAAGQALEYRDGATNSALLPPIQFTESFLPRPSVDARYDGGFATAGAFLGHVIVRSRPVQPPPQVTFEPVRLLTLRTDLICGTQAAVVQTKSGDDVKDRAYTREEYEAMIAVGVNYFAAEGEALRWLWAQPVFCRMTPRFPDTYYRSNWIPGRMFIDEPSVRLGWGGDIPVNPSAPEQVAEAMRQRVQSHYALRHRELPMGNGAESGTLDLLAPPAVSWDTDYWSAWYQMAAGAPAVVHEGRYYRRGCGWEPEDLFGQEGLADLTLTDQVNCLNAFLRGAARVFGRDWGISEYPEGDPKLRRAALLQGHDMGARYIWFWSWPPMTYDLQKTLMQELMRHAADHPRGALADVNRAARVAIALPPGYVFGWRGTWGMEREQRSRGGASFGDISAAAMWEGILCSRRGIPFDFVVDDPRTRSVGYERIVYVRKDGSVDVQPPWPANRPAGPISLAFNDEPVPNVAQAASGDADYTVGQAGTVTIDGRLDDWPEERFFKLTSDEHGFPDVVSVQTQIVNDLSRPEWRLHFGSYMGFRYTQITEDLERKYVLEDLQGKGVVVTEVAPGSPAAKADIRPGDVIRGLLTWPILYEFQVYQRLEGYKDKHDGAVIPVRLRRSGRYDFGRPGDLGARVALGVDDQRLLIAAEVLDDVHHQPHHDADFWKGDCVQIALDPTLERRTAGFGEEDHEIVLVLSADGPLVWRYAGRRGQPVGRTTDAHVRIVRERDRTLYEAAIPLSEFPPLAPDLWPRAGFDVVVSDADAGVLRKGRLELRPKAMTLGKKTSQFATLEFEPSADGARVSAALLWRRRATPQDGYFRLVVAARSPETRSAKVRATLRSLDSPQTSATTAELALPVTSDATEHSLIVKTDPPPGRYDLSVEVEGPLGSIVTRDHLPVYIYPAAAANPVQPAHEPPSR
ncbi:MAG: PDZ domain-containing protein [Planctomycetes bacterium]|nr:PDZ domain-containing protein [Planctomycetota bacterium]